MENEVACFTAKQIATLIAQIARVVTLIKKIKFAEYNTGL
jgi:hypothetical protein